MMKISSIVSYDRVRRHSRISGAKRTYSTFKWDSTYEPITSRNWHTELMNVTVTPTLVVRVETGHLSN